MRFKTVCTLASLLLLAAFALAGQKSYVNVAVTSHGDKFITVLLPNGVFSEQQLCIGTQQQMDKGGIDCYASVPFPVPAELRVTSLPGRVALPPSMEPKDGPEALDPNGIELGGTKG